MIHEEEVNDLKKKLISLILTFIFVFSLAGSAFADWVTSWTPYRDSRGVINGTSVTGTSGWRSYVYVKAQLRQKGSYSEAIVAQASSSLWGVPAVQLSATAKYSGGYGYFYRTTGVHQINGSVSYSSSGYRLL